MRANIPELLVTLTCAFVLGVTHTNGVSAATGSISGSPNPCGIPQGQSTCSSTITWSSQGASVVQVRLSMDGAPTTNFATSGAGGPYSQGAPWIQAGHTYVFYLYDYSSGSQGAQLALVQVTGATIGTGTISANPPNSCTILGGQTTCTAQISWSSQNTSQVQVWVTFNNGPETNFASSGSGGPYSQNATWIQATAVYSFKLYSYSGSTRLGLLAQIPAYVGIVCTWE
jgi:hypothetical protein